MGEAGCTACSKSTIDFPDMANSGRGGHAGGTSALPPKPDIEAKKSSVRAEFAGATRRIGLAIKAAGGFSAISEMGYLHSDVKCE